MIFKYTKHEKERLKLLQTKFISEAKKNGYVYAASHSGGEIKADLPKRENKTESEYEKMIRGYVNDFSLAAELFNHDRENELCCIRDVYCGTVYIYPEFANALEEIQENRLSAMLKPEEIEADAHTVIKQAIKHLYIANTKYMAFVKQKNTEFDGGSLSYIGFCQSLSDYKMAYLPTMFNWDFSKELSQNIEIEEENKLDLNECKALIKNIFIYRHIDHLLKSGNDFCIKQLESYLENALRKSEYVRHEKYIKKPKDETAIPEKMPVPTSQGYKHMLSFLGNNMEEERAAIVMIDKSMEIDKDNHTIFFKGDSGRPLEYVEVVSAQDKTKAMSIDPGLFRAIHAARANDIQKNWDISKGIQDMPEKMIISAAQIAKILGFTRGKLTAGRILRILDKEYKPLKGQIKEANGRYSYYDFVNVQFDSRTNSFIITTPYFDRALNEMWKQSIKNDTKAEKKAIACGKPMTKPIFSYLVHTNIASVRNKAAVELVYRIVQGIETCGCHEYSVSAKTLVNDNMYLCGNLGTNPAQKLSRSFSKAFELLRSHTDLLQTYIDIKLPDPSDTPSPKEVHEGTKIYHITHNGKRKKKGAK